MIASAEMLLPAITGNLYVVFLSTEVCVLCSSLDKE